MCVYLLVYQTSACDKHVFAVAVHTRTCTHTHNHGSWATECIKVTIIYTSQVRLVKVSKQGVEICQECFI